MASNHFQRDTKKQKGKKKITFPLPQPKDPRLIKFMIRRLGEEKAKKRRVPVFVDRDTNEVSISGSEYEIAEGEKLTRSLIEEYNKDVKSKKANNAENRRTVKIPDKVMGCVIGKQGCNLHRVERETGARVLLCQGKISVSGTDKQCRAAMKKLKSNACDVICSNELKQQCHLFDFVDGTGPKCDYKLETIPKECVKTYWRQEENYFKISREDMDEDDEIANGEIQMDDLENIVKKALEQTKKLKTVINGDGVNGSDDGLFPKSDFWLHFGHIFITGNVDEADQGKELSLADFQANLNQKPGWKMLFDSAIKEMEVTALEDALSGNIHVTIPPHTRYDISFITPSCNRIRVKIFLDSSGEPTKDFLDQFVDIPLDQLQSDAVYVLSDLFYHRAKISIAIPSRSMDVRMHFRTISESSSLTRTRENLNEKRILKAFLDRITIEDGEVNLPDDLPDEFFVLYFRRCQRRSYCYDDGEESFTIVISDEQEIDPGHDGEQFEVKTDVHINSDGINQLLRSGKWQSEEIIDKLPKFLSVVRDIQANISCD